MKNLFALIGVVTVIMMVCVIVILIVQSIRDFIGEKMYEYRYEHRFGKSPTAKCYCVDCKYWRKDDGRCSQFEGYYTADCWFCWKAEPMSREEYNRRESE